MDENEWLTRRFEEQRPRLRSVAYRVLGSLAEADDAVQEAWLRLNRSDTSEVENLAAWLTTVVGRISLNVLRSRATRPAESLEVHMPELIIEPVDHGDPEQEALVADSVGVALLVVLERLAPAERLAFVLHDVFGVPFEEIGPMVDRSPAAARKLASRARRRVQGDAAAPDGDLAAQREVVDAFFAAGRTGDFDRLVALLHPDVVLRVDLGGEDRGISATTKGAAAVAGRALMFADIGREVHSATINGAAGVVVVANGRVASVMGFTVIGGRVSAIDVLADPERLDRLDRAPWTGRERS